MGLYLNVFTFFLENNAMSVINIRINQYATQLSALVIFIILKWCQVKSVAMIMFLGGFSILIIAI